MDRNMIIPVIRFTDQTLIMEDERILYPCYFNKDLKRKEGRRVPVSAGISKPDTQDIYKAAKKMGLSARTGESKHPAHWTEKGGRIIVSWKGSKEILIKKIAEKLSEGK
jgi:signal recognition particle subunit SRP19